MIHIRTNLKGAIPVTSFVLAEWKTRLQSASGSPKGFDIILYSKNMVQKLGEVQCLLELFCIIIGCVH